MNELKSEARTKQGGRKKKKRKKGGSYLNTSNVAMYRSSNDSLSLPNLSNILFDIFSNCVFLHSLPAIASILSLKMYQFLIPPFPKRFLILLSIICKQTRYKIRRDSAN